MGDDSNLAFLFGVGRGVQRFMDRERRSSSLLFDILAEEHGHYELGHLSQCDYGNAMELVDQMGIKLDVIPVLEYRDGEKDQEYHVEENGSDGDQYLEGVVLVYTVFHVHEFPVEETQSFDLKSIVRFNEPRGTPGTTKLD